MSGKGSTRRPTLVDRSTADAAWERTFGTKDAIQAWEESAARADMIERTPGIIVNLTESDETPTNG